MNNFDPDCDIYDVPSQPRPLDPLAPTLASPADRAGFRLEQQREYQLRLAYLSMLAQATTITEVTTPMTGDDISDEYIALYKNNTNNPVRVQVFADLATPGCGAILSTVPDKSNAGKVDVLSLTANGRVESVPVIILPTMSIWAREFNVAFPMSGFDVLRVRVFDPAKLLSYANLYPKKG